MVPVPLLEPCAVVMKLFAGLEPWYLNIQKFGFVPKNVTDFITVLFVISLDDWRVNTRQ